MHLLIEAIVLWLIIILSVDAKAFDKFSVKSDYLDDDNRGSNLRLIQRQDIPSAENQKLYIIGLNKRFNSKLRRNRRFHEIDSKGFDENIFDEGFGDFSTMRKRSF